MEAPGLLSWGGASAIAAVTFARWRPQTVGSRRKVRREPIDLDLVELSLLREEVAMDGDTRGDRPMAMTSRLSPETRLSTAADVPVEVPGAPGPRRNGAAGTTPPPTGLPSEQLYTWLEWVQDDLRRIEARLEYLHAARDQLAEQERLLGELLASAGPLSRR